MTWTKLSDDYADECWTLSDAAFRLHTEALVWSARKLLDCRIPVTDLPRFSRCPDAADELLGCGWWSLDMEAGVYELIYHARYQLTREQAARLQKRNQENGKKGGRPPKPGREHKPDAVVPITQMETQVGTQMETQRDGTGRDLPKQPPTDVSSTRTPAREEEPPDDDELLWGYQDNLEAS